jgi:UDP-N-acetylmuramate--alanine ligase
VVSSAVNESNPEVQEARRLGFPVIPRGELLAELMRLKYGIAIAGSHGKTTTTSMVAAILSHAGMDPTVVVGGKAAAMGGSNARVGKSEFLVVESDESDGSFLKLSPILAIVTNIDREHLDHYADIEAIRAAFTEFVNKVPFYGAAIVCLDDENVQAILPPSGGAKSLTAEVHRPITSPVKPKCEGMHSIVPSARSQNGSGFADLGVFRVNSPGAHNVLNATAAIAVALELGRDAGRGARGLAKFTGVGRRFEIKGEVNGIRVVDDYGHHPTEILATLAAARSCCGGRVHVLCSSPTAIHAPCT